MSRILGTVHDLLLIGSACLACFSAPRALAQDYPPITASDFNLDYSESTVSGSSRIIGMGGAFAAVAEGVAAFPMNPASLSRRTSYSTDWFDYDIALDWLIPGVGSDMDLDNSGLPGLSEGSFTFILGGLGLQFGRLGAGVYFRGRNYDLSASGAGGTPEAFQFTLLEVDLGVSYEIVSGALYLGAGYAGAFLDVKRRVGTGLDDFEKLVGFQSNFLRLGLLLCVPESGFSFGASFAYPAALSRTVGGDEAVAGRHMPRKVLRPWEVTLGSSWRWNFSPAEEERRFLRLALDLLLIGPSEDAVTVQGFLLQLRQRAGERPSFGVRLGAESEVIANRLQLRAGSYLEPARRSDSWGRLHFTAGADVRLFQLVWDWKLSFAADIASRYSNLCLGVGFWH
ncbi:MAG: hypothetical protein GYA21_12980 [Myxococcales bacterium]|nr:hypothetical protein [Myxococcales bacterium]